MTKYHAKRSGGFASKKEHRRAQELELLQKCGEITELKHQVKFVLIPKQGKERPITYTADATYIENGNLVVEDAKGYKTQQYIIRRKLMKFIHGVEIREV